MASLVLVDSSVFIGLGRAGRDPLHELRFRRPGRDWATCGIVRVEVMRGLRSPTVKQVFAVFFDALVSAPTTNLVWEEVERLAWTLDRRGILLPATDILIACCARSVEAAVFSFDQHFEQIPGVRLYSTLAQLR